MNVWEIAILKSVESRGGSATTKEIYTILETGKYIQMNESHKRKTIYGGRPAYQHQVRSHLSNLLQAGDLNRISRGTYSLSKQGYNRIKYSNL